MLRRISRICEKWAACRAKKRWFDAPHLGQDLRHRQPPSFTNRLQTFFGTRWRVPKMGRFMRGRANA
jgi:hypothetical protein